ncbi:uncharacterized protein LOC144132607 isoform X1 [Amblyomma americanum]
MFVYIEYQSSLKTAVVEHTQIQTIHSNKKEAFNPLDADDFEPADTYRVHSCNGDNSDCEYVNVKIIHMTETLEEMVLYRAKRPRMSVVQEEVDSQKPREEGPQPSRPSARRQERGHAKWVQRQRLIERVLRDYEMEPMPANNPKALENRLRAMEEQLSRAKPGEHGQSSPSATGSGDSVPKSAYAVLRQKYEALQRDIEELRAQNSDLEKSLKSKISEGEGSPVGTARSGARESTVPVQTPAAQESNGHVSDTEDCAQLGAHSGEKRSANNAKRGVAPSTVPAPTSAEKSKGYTSEAEDCAQSCSRFSFAGHTSEAEDCSQSFAHSRAEPDLDESFNTDRPESVYNMRGDEDPIKAGTRREDGKVYAGCDHWISWMDWERLFKAPTDSNFCAQAASMFWTEEELVKRSVTGKVSNAAVARGTAVHRLPLSPEKLGAIKNLFKMYTVKDAFAARRMKNVRSHLSAFLCYKRQRRSRRLEFCGATEPKCS